MRAPVFTLSVAALGLAGLAVGFGLAAEQAPEWRINATAIEACSCPMFCPCYFNPSPAGHHGAEGEEHFCRFNMGYRVNQGNYGEVDLAGAHFWIAGDLGEEFDDGRMDWARVHFDPSVTAEQRGAIATILGHVFPVEWDDFAVGDDATIAWTHEGDHAEARLGDDLATIVLTPAPLRNTDDPVVIHNLAYWGAPRNDGFVLMPHEVQAYRLGEKAFEYAGGNGFMITIDMSSADVPAPAAETGAP
jgi:hypothetical protein